MAEKNWFDRVTQQFNLGLTIEPGKGWREEEGVFEIKKEEEIIYVIYFPHARSKSIYVLTKPQPFSASGEEVKGHFPRLADLLEHVFWTYVDDKKRELEEQI